MKLKIFKLSAFEGEILKECPTMFYGASFIKFIAYFPVLISFFAGYVALSILDFFPVWSNIILAGIVVLFHILVIRRFDSWLHAKKSWSVMLIISFCLLVIAFLQAIFISNYLFAAESLIDKILRPGPRNIKWLKGDILFVLSFRNNIVSVMTIALAVISIFTGILPFGLTFYYRKSKYYQTYKLVEKFKMSYDRT